MPSVSDEINEQRKQKVADLRAGDIDPYPHRFARTHTTQEALGLLKDYTAKNPETSQAPAKGLPSDSAWV